MPDFSSPSKAKSAKVMADLRSPSKPRSAKAIADFLSPPRPPRPPKFGKSTAESDSGVRVIVRLRPLNEKEQQEHAVSTISTITDNLIAVADHQYTFDAVATESSSQEDMFRLAGVPVIENCIAGFNSSIFAYGQTGSGKTYTMWGTRSYPGLAPRVVESLFARVREEETKNVGKNLFYRCRCSFLEIFNEQVADLLDPRHRNLQIREDVKRGVYVDNLTEEYLSNAADVSRMLDKGLANRRIGATSMNTESSRSHTVFTCVLECRFRSAADGMSSVRKSRINLVDLAGSERQGQSGAAGDRLREAGNINRSLSQLGNVINILAEVAQTGRQRHVPYRDSRLTFLLQESLGGNAKLAMICAISPADSCKSETASTLRFAQRAKSIQNKAVINEETTNDSNILREQIRELKDELKRMKAQAKQPAGGEGWNARRSYSLLRSSLALPMTLPRTAESDTDEDMEVEEREADISIQQDDMVGDTDVCHEAWEMQEIAELRRALELAMAGQAKLLEQYADLQEKYVALVDKQRKIREGMMDARKMGVKVGLTNTQLRWMESLSAQIVALNLEREQERQAANEEIEVLQAQLSETRAAAGEILVQLKESEAAQAEPSAPAAPVLDTDADANSLNAAPGNVFVELRKDEASIAAAAAALEVAGPAELVAPAPASDNVAFSATPVAGPTKSVWVNEDEEMCNYYASL